MPRAGKSHNVLHEFVAPHCARRHFDKVLHVQRRDHRFLGAILASVSALHADALAAAFDHQLHDGLIRKNHAVM